MMLFGSDIRPYLLQIKLYVNMYVFYFVVSASVWQVFFRLVPVEFFPAGAGGRFTAKIAGLPTAPGTVSQGLQLRVITDGSECRDCRFCSVVQQVVA